jgi:ketol-acid reductoisomerase
MSNDQSASPSLRFYSARDALPGALNAERVAVLGYGNLGRALSLNLRDAGVPHLIVGNVADGYADQARADGFTVLPIAEATAASDLMLVLLPDEVIPEAFAQAIAPNLSPGAAIVFASGYTLAYGLIEPPANVDVLLLAPRMGGELARERFLEGRGFFAYVSVEQDASGKARERLLGIAHAVGVLQSGALELDARSEADLDLLVEQTLGAVIGVAVMSAFNLGVEAGIPPEAMVLEMYMSGEMETVFRAFREKGFYRASDTHGPTALYGGFVRTMDLMQSDLVATFRETWEDIRSGGFARRFQAEREAGYPTLSVAQSMSAEESPVTQPQVQAEANVREMFGGSDEETR